MEVEPVERGEGANREKGEREAAYSGLGKKV